MTTERAKLPKNWPHIGQLQTAPSFVERSPFRPSHESKTRSEMMRFPANPSEPLAVRGIPTGSQGGPAKPTHAQSGALAKRMDDTR